MSLSPPQVPLPPPVVAPGTMPAIAAEAGATELGARAWALAVDAGIPLAHFEHRFNVEPPAAFAVEGRPDLGEVQGWVDGVLPETKFRHFRLDRMVMSFHPGQRAKWTAHEAIHRLVGWAWWPGISRLELATVARVAEALPVAAWYAFDEEGRRRCDRHRFTDAWGAGACVACERAALDGPLPTADDASRRADGRAFLERELAAAEASVREGRVLPSPWRSVDLASDGLAWAAAHGPRLDHPAFVAWVERFVPVGHGRFDSLAAFIERVRAVAAALLDGAPLAPWPCGAEAWRLQDLAQRVGEIRVDCAPACAAALDRALARAAASGRVEELVAGYAAAAERWSLPPAEEVWAVGYWLPGIVDAAPSPQLAAGVASAFPATSMRLGSAREAFVAAFAAADPLLRRPLARRVLAVAEANNLLPPPLLALARLEAALADPIAVDLGALTLAADLTPDQPLRLGAVELVEVPSGWEAALGGAGRGALGRGKASTVAVRRAPDGAPEILPMSPAAAAVCAAMAAGPLVPSGVPEGEWAALVGAGVWVR